MQKVCFLSYPLCEIAPAYGDDEYKIDLRQLKSISKGDNCNTYWIGMDNHVGTHVDAPAHYFKDAMTVSDYSAEHWHFRTPFVLDLELKENQLVEIRHLHSVPMASDILIVKSGFYRYRGSEIYSCNNPGIDPNAAIWMRANLPHLRAVGVDFVSVSPYQDRDLGRETHRCFLDPCGKNNPINIIEDMDLSGNLHGLSEVIALPIRLEGIDSAPCTVVGICKNERFK